MDPSPPDGAAGPMDLPTSDTLSLDKTIPLVPARSVPAVGEQLGDYRLIRKLGSGGFGEVWEAEDVTTKRRLALKVLTQTQSPSADLLERFKREGKLAASVNHPRCVFVFGAEDIEGLPVIAMELMSGGTLQDRLNQGAGIPSRQAVDMILEIMEGLEVAHSAGILHRDVKPSNCFVDQTGGCKIGDFGISKSLEAPADLTLTGGFIGTPAYASPEQIRATELDVRSDIYSVGATLYALVTGKPPFEGKGGAVLARIVAGEVTPISVYSVSVPKGLLRTILRAMSKDREKRFANYSTLRVALLPFSSHGLTPGSVLKRILAYSIDNGLLLIVSFVVYWSIGSEAPIPLRMGILFLYLFFTEKHFGRTLGKYLLRLRVTSADGTPITYQQSLLRTGVWCLLLLVPSATRELFQSFAIRDWLVIASLSVPFVTMRSRNGYAGLHEILSKTRVMMLKKGQRLATPVQEFPRVATDRSRAERRGPYVVEALFWKNGSQALLAGYDEALGRQIWIHESATQPSHSINSLIAVRPFRLRWLQGVRKDKGNWDAYEAPRGIGFCEWVTTRGCLGWGEVREILLGVASEIDALLRDGRSDFALSANQIWIDSTGTAKLLPFAAPQRNGTLAVGFAKFKLNEWAQFLHEITYFGLRGRLRPARHEEGALPRVPLPEYARAVVKRICQPAESLLEITPRSHIEDLQRTSTRPASVTRIRRLGPSLIVVFPGLLSLGAIVMTSLLLPTISARWPWLMDLASTPRYESVLRGIPDGTHRWDPETAEAIRKILAHAYQQANSTNEGRQILSGFPPQGLRELRDNAERYPQLSEAEFEEARRRVPQFRFDMSLSQMAGAGVFALWVFGLLLAVGSILMAAIFRAGPTFRLFDLSIQTLDGESAGRLRCVARAVIAWLPLLALAAVLFGSPIARQILPVPALVSAISIVLLGVAVNMVNPARGIPDWIAGTSVVPR